MEPLTEVVEEYIAFLVKLSKETHSYRLRKSAKHPETGKSLSPGTIVTKELGEKLGLEICIPLNEHGTELDKYKEIVYKTHVPEKAYIDLDLEEKVIEVKKEGQRVVAEKLADKKMLYDDDDHTLILESDRRADIPTRVGDALIPADEDIFLGGKGPASAINDTVTKIVEKKQEEVKKSRRKAKAKKEAAKAKKKDSDSK